MFVTDVPDGSGPVESREPGSNGRRFRHVEICVDVECLLPVPASDVVPADRVLGVGQSVVDPGLLEPVTTLGCQPERLGVLGYGLLVLAGPVKHLGDPVASLGLADAVPDQA